MEIPNGIYQKAPPPPLISIQLLAHFFSFAIESYLFETEFTLGLNQNYHS